MKPHVRVGVIGHSDNVLFRTGLLAAIESQGIRDLTQKDIDVVNLPRMTAQEAEKTLNAMSDAKNFEKVLIVCDSIAAEEEKRKNLMAAKAATVGMMEYHLFQPRKYHENIFPFRRKVPVKMVKCDLPECNVMHSHNGGYCCPEHCKEHRSIK